MKSGVLFVGQRVTYNVPNVDVDVLEDHAESCLWLSLVLCSVTHVASFGCSIYFDFD